MSLTVWNKTNGVATVPNANSYTIVGHNNNATGANQLLFVNVETTGATMPISATWNGVPMAISGGASQTGINFTSFSLVAPANGAQNLVIGLTSVYASQIGFSVTSFSNCAGVGNVAFSDRSASPNSKTLTVSENSRVFIQSHSINVISSFSVDGTTYSPPFDSNNINVGGNLVSSDLSDAITSSGSINTTATGLANLACNRIEILEAATGGAPGSFFLMF